MPDTEGFEIVECLKEFLGISFRKNSFASIELANTLLDFYKNQNNEQETIEFEIVGFCFDICVLSFSLLLRSVIPNANISVFKNLCGSSKDDDNYINAVENICKANAINVVDYKGE